MDSIDYWNDFIRDALIPPMPFEHYTHPSFHAYIQNNIRIMKMKAHQDNGF